ncbi:hypothetical protein EYF80_066958 [Liparis tanakae]|uniref:Uncharacterized protein n=1 Tax=Liparis tanakae TaxID=230148 RepID=A0A4Z2E219_9TELE|nr:hypothetical protein EYF80_066958 [Liparis tanakae]
MIGSAEDSVRSALQTQEERLSRIEQLISGRYKELHDQQSSLTEQLRDMLLPSEPVEASCCSQSPDRSALAVPVGYSPCLVGAPAVLHCPLAATAVPVWYSPCLASSCCRLCAAVLVDPSSLCPFSVLVDSGFPYPCPVSFPAGPSSPCPFFSPTGSSPSCSYSVPSVPSTIPAGSRPRPFLCLVLQLPVPVLRPTPPSAFCLGVALQPTPQTASAMPLSLRRLRSTHPC